MSMLRLIVALVFVLSASVELLAQDAVKIGDRVGKLKFTDIRYLPRTLDDFGAKKAYVLVFTTVGCPVAERYIPTLKALAPTQSEPPFLGTQVVGMLVFIVLGFLAAKRSPAGAVHAA